MKKFAIACAAVFALALTSCGEVEKCWTLSYDVYGVKVEANIWGTGNDVQAAIEEVEAMYPDVEITKTANGKSAGDCY